MANKTSRDSSYEMLCIDPGLTTGWVHLRVSPGEPAEVINSGEMRSTPGEVGSLVQDWLSNSDQRMVLYESFISLSHEHHVDANPPVQAIGIIEWLCQDFGVDVVSQTPSERKQVSEQMLKDSGYWLVGGAGHKRQALRHGLSYLIKNQHRPTMEKLLKRG